MCKRNDKFFRKKVIFGLKKEYIKHKYVYFGLKCLRIWNIFCTFAADFRKVKNER